MLNEWTKINYKKINDFDSSLLVEDSRKHWQKLTDAGLPTREKEYLIMIGVGVYIVASYDDSNSSPVFWNDSEMYEPLAWMEFKRY